MSTNKRYDNQILIDIENQKRFDRYEWWNEGSQVLSIFVNLPESEKDCWLVNYDDEDKVVLSEEAIISPSTKPGFFHKLFHKWTQAKIISNAISKDMRVAWINDSNTLTTEQRQKIVKKFPNYQKRIIVYESNMNGLSTTYERPSSEEGFDDITFVI
jgi:hypothetical protein